MTVFEIMMITMMTLTKKTVILAFAGKPMGKIWKSARKKNLRFLEKPSK